MTLHLRIIKAPDGATSNQSQQTLDERGGSIGRGPGNSWVLPDPERILSSRHCEFVCEGGRYQLIDHSTNGTFINGSPEPVGRGTAVPVHHGDEIEVGDYRFSVELEAAGQSIVDSPFAPSYGSSAMDDVPAPSTDDPFASDPFDSSASLSLNGAAEVMDPLQALDQAGAVSDPQAVDASPWGLEPDSDPLMNDGMRARAPAFGEADPWAETPHSSALMDSGPAGDAIDWPESHPENLIPDDWLDDELAGPSPALQPSEPPIQPAPVPEAAVTPRPTAPDNRIPTADSFGIEDAAPLSAPEPQAQEPPAVPPRPRPGARPAAQAAPAQAAQRQVAQPRSAQPQREQPQIAPPQQAATPERRTPNSTEGDALVEAMGLDASRLSEAERAELYPLAGRLVREVVSGLMQVLRSRASIKNEFRMNVTTIQPVENNPLKFSADVDEALENIFVRRSPAYKPPLEAVHEGFQEIAEHQLAMIAGMRSAFEHMLEEFNPEHLEPRFKKQQKPSPIPALLQHRYWRQYQEYYQDLNDNIERSFQQVFGDEFVQAYQDQLRRLTASRSS